MQRVIEKQAQPPVYKKKELTENKIFSTEKQTKPKVFIFQCRQIKAEN